MRIGFVAEPYEEKNASGMGYVVRELMRHFAQQNAGDELLFYSSSPISRELVPGSFTPVTIPRGFIRQFFYFLFLKDAPDVLLFMVPLLPLVLVRGRAVPLCQELASQKIRPEGVRENLFAFIRDRILMRFSLARAPRIVAASEATKADLVHFYGVSPQRIPVVYDGFQDLSVFAHHAPAIEESLQPYFFFIGKVKYRKNVHGIAEGFVKFKEATRAPCKLVIAGDYGGDYYTGIIRHLEEHQCTHDVHFVGYTVKEQLYAYYASALACVFPSLNEGFGMPIIEAMSLGIPVITSNISSMAEVAGDAAVLVDPHDTDDIARAMGRIYSDEALRRSLAEKGRARARDFSWPKAAREIIALVHARA